MPHSDDPQTPETRAGRKVLYAFGPYVFDPSSGELRGPDSGTKRLQQQPAKLLEHFLENPAEVVPRERIRDLLWADTKVEYDQGINFCVRKIREALDESADEAGFIETLPGRGYRFRGDVTRKARGTTAEGPSRSRSVARGFWVAAGVAVLAALVFWIGGSGEEETAPSEPLVAVFPYGTPPEDHSFGKVGRRTSEIVVVGLTRSGDGRIRVAGPASTSPLLQSSTPTELARSELGACLLVRGTLDRTQSGSAVAFTEVIRTTDNAHIWARRDTFAVEDASDYARDAADELTRVVLEDVATSPDCPGVPS